MISRILRAMVALTGARMSEIVHHIFGGTNSQYFNQPSADFFHGSHRGLLGRAWEKRTRTILQLPRALGGDDDEAVRAVFQIIRNGIHRVVLQSLSHVSSTSILREAFQDATSSLIPQASRIEGLSANDSGG